MRTTDRPGRPRCCCAFWGPASFWLPLACSRPVLLVVLGPESSRTKLISVLGRRVDYLTVHQGFFVAWLVLTGLHVLARILPALRLTVARRDHSGAVPGGIGRIVAVVFSLAAAVASAVLVLSAADGTMSRPGPTGPAKPRSFRAPALTEAPEPLRYSRGESPSL